MRKATNQNRNSFLAPHADASFSVLYVHLLSLYQPGYGIDNQRTKKNIAFSCTADRPDNTVFFCDPLLLQRCLSNIVQNAFQYTKEGGEVKFILDRIEDEGGGKVRIRILNTGSIPEIDLPKIFNRLYRGDRSRSTAGSGLGLSIAKAVVSLHHGSVSVRNIPPGEDGAGCNKTETPMVCVSVLIPESAVS